MVDPDESKMKTLFTIKYHTIWGERLLISGSCAELGNDIIANAKEMYYYDDDEWRVEIILPDSIKEITYFYLVEDANGVRKTENNESKHHIFFNHLIEVYEPNDGSIAKQSYETIDYKHIKFNLHDKWLSKPDDKTFYTSALTKNIFARPAKVTPKCLPDAQNILFIQVRAPNTKPHQLVALTGNQPLLGNWNPNNALFLSEENFPIWEIQLNADEISFPLEYKFVVLDSETNHLCYWEEGENRTMRQPPQMVHTSHLQITVDDCRFRAPDLSWKACGTVIPVFALRSRQSFGIGDIGDLKKLIDWAKITNQHVIQVLPVNDTTRTHTWRDSYPYSAISIYALHPLYINVPMLGELNDIKKKAHYQKIQQQLNEKATVDYPSVEKYKTAYYRDYFDQEKDNIFTNMDFRKFIASNKEWLMPYATFTYLRDIYQTSDFTKWGNDADYNPEKMEKLYQSDSNVYHEFSYLFFIQYTLHTQFEAIFRYARENRVILKGDLPIGVNRESVETWIEPCYFHRQAQAGAPPDLFSEKGQNWSFPTYNWDAMKQDDFVWWKKRLQHMQQYFDSIRIDHILGFFRIWEIPLDYKEGLCGHFNPSLPLQKTEIEQYGMTFDEQWLTPRIHVKYLPELFGSPELFGYDNINSYLHHCDPEHLSLNENCSTQLKIAQFFNGRNDKKSQRIKDGLMFIANEVLFITDHSHTNADVTTASEDMYFKRLFHPRILANRSYAYRELSDENKHAFDRLYHDFFFNRHNEFWRKTAISRLQPLLKNTEMLVCGEDLGMLPATVQEVLRFLQILSLDLERLSKVIENDFTDLAKLPYHSVCTTSTHDMNPIRAWWMENREITQRYYNNILGYDGIAPKECSSAIAEKIITNHLRASSMLTMIPLQDWFALDDNILQMNDLQGENLQERFVSDEIIRQHDVGTERINDPANPDHYWCYRMHLTIETLLQSTNFNQKISAMITENGR